MKSHRRQLYPNLDDIGLFNLLREDDELAFSELYARYSSKIYMFIFLYVKDKELSEDVLQHIFMGLWENRRTIKITSSVRNYLITSAKNHVLNQIRAKRVRLQFAEKSAGEALDVIPTPEEIFEREEMFRILDLALADIRHELKEQIISLRRDGLSNIEVAERLGIPVNTVKTYYAQGLRSLRLYFKKHFPTK